MADVSEGPVRTLPGALMSLPPGTMCDSHPTVLAVARVQGETDSFGAEFHDVCEECRAQFHKNVIEHRVGDCEWCRQRSINLRPTRDYDEGMTGPVYNVCGACAKKQRDEAIAYLEDDN